MADPHPGFGEPERLNAQALIHLALAEDLGDRGDATTTAVIPEAARGSARLVARTAGVLAGLPVVALVLEAFDVRGWRPHKADGDALRAGDLIAEIEGDFRSILTLERTALNFVQRLSGVATLTSRFVAEVEGTAAKILDTRKTTPGWRMLEKYAVRCGGGSNHRIGLYDAVLIKDNHLAWLASRGALDPIPRALAAARAGVPKGTLIEVEVDTLDQLDVALACRPDVILVDNLGPEALVEAVRRRDASAPGVLLESSGGITLATVAARARTGVDRISVGALTHSAVALDVALDVTFEEP
ncbi:carboxylating nicotinate-nucleotide diphosphorylase [Paludisphaera rhizosphaerae]|uniref:carboxylating nicotinate-nucleotide diphosphorylase n=1 Tax=Paludisphaera rhizosphaerae TaxID=2711216 RepID=UPI0013EBD70C|nr:carboxylating nicotinate-nucleotide diphosphorylase [Paludisphaera rhizosphaerae]